LFEDNRAAIAIKFTRIRFIMAISELLGSISSSQIWSFGALFLVVTVIIDVVSDFASHPPIHIPSMGKSGRLNSFIDSFRAIKNYNKWIRDGYSKVSACLYS
jgi:hypothetical protein